MRLSCLRTMRSGATVLPPFRFCSQASAVVAQPKRSPYNRRTGSAHKPTKTPRPRPGEEVILFQRMFGVGLTCGRRARKVPPSSCPPSGYALPPPAPPLVSIFNTSARNISIVPSSHLCAISPSTPNSRIVSSKVLRTAAYCSARCFFGSVTICIAMRWTAATVASKFRCCSGVSPTIRYSSPLFTVPAKLRKRPRTRVAPRIVHT
jgi:hypothetical protein